MMDRAMKREVTVEGVTMEPAFKITVQHKDIKTGVVRTLSLPQFYAEVLKCPIKFDKLPCFFRRTRVRLYLSIPFRRRVSRELGA